MVLEFEYYILSYAPSKLYFAGKKLALAHILVAHPLGVFGVEPVVLAVGMFDMLEAGWSYSYPFRLLNKIFKNGVFFIRINFM